MRLSFIGNQVPEYILELSAVAKVSSQLGLWLVAIQKAEGVPDLQLFYSYFWQWEGLPPQNYFYIISIASPKEKNLYLSCTASSYAASTCSLPASADTNIISVDSGKWKFVINPSRILNLYPG